jgi:hypothetical protein
MSAIEFWLLGIITVLFGIVLLSAWKDKSIGTAAFGVTGLVLVWWPVFS